MENKISVVSQLSLLEVYLTRFLKDSKGVEPTEEHLLELVGLVNAAPAEVVAKLFKRDQSSFSDTVQPLLSAMLGSVACMNALGTRGLMNLVLIGRSDNSLSTNALVRKLGSEVIAILSKKGLTGAEQSALSKQFPERLTNSSRKESLKIAICISGQLRGYQKIWATIKKLGLSSHDYKVYVHTWSNVGRKLPTGNHAGRIFSGNMLEAFQKVERILGITDMQRSYPALFELVAEAPPVQAEDVKRFFAAEKAIVEDDTDSSFKGMSNQDKMLYKIAACFDMALADDGEFDLVVRMRPDRGFKSAISPIDWHQILRTSIEERAIFANGHGSWLSNGGYAVADQFAVGETSLMEKYCHADRYYAKPEIRSAFRPASCEGFGKLGFSLLSHGLVALPLAEYTNIELGKISEYDLPLAQDIVECLESDIARRAVKLPTDAVFEEAIQALQLSAGAEARA